ncbi:NfeD family protein [Actibacterium lipolyticum]|uniref:NfeD-like C-terminal domain-containing protein n=1 Tax=Actibacterium lipolyticum TaxID=1524263 RepID=A0A238KU48_9RHOB|nr:hypothetical protein [Actibacterium lipolyticum]SMX46170.1 hypothetical protein COL8621_02994 [Actibacterium lipolyticum]
MWALWWVWLAGAVVLAILEVLAPGFVFLGFAIGAAATGGLLALGLTPHWATLALIFALVSLAAWFALRKVFGLKGGQVKTFDTDINDN